MKYYKRASFVDLANDKMPKRVQVQNFILIVDVVDIWKL